MNSSSLLPWESFKSLLAFDHESIEAQVEVKDELYPGLNLEALYTDLREYAQIFSHPRIKGSWCELGCGVGIGNLFYAYLYPERRAVGIELASARAWAFQREKERLGLSNVEVIQGDLLTTSLPQADNYFLYFPTGPVLDRILSELQSRTNFTLIAIESHGDLFSRLDEEAQLELVDTLTLTQKRHSPDARIYRSRIPERAKDPMLELTFKNSYLWINDGTDLWLGESQGAEWIKAQTFNLKYPPRTIHSGEIKQVMTLDELSPLLRYLCGWRRLGVLSLITANKSSEGQLRKIISEAGGFSLELSSGERLKWQEITSISWNQNLCYDSRSCSFYLPPAP